MAPIGVGDNPTAPVAPVALAARFLAAQAEVQKPSAQLGSVDALVDPLGAHARQLVLPEVSPDLFRAQVKGEQELHRGPGLRGNASRVGTGPHADLCQFMGMIGKVVSLPAATSDFTANRARVSLHHGGNLALLVKRRTQQDSEHDSIVFAQTRVCFGLGEMYLVHSATLTWRLGEGLDAIASRPPN